MFTNLKQKDLRLVQSAIETQRRKLIKKVKESGIYENFGQSEIRKLEDKYINSSSYTNTENAKRLLLDGFNEWCMIYNGE